MPKPINGGYRQQTLLLLYEMWTITQPAIDWKQYKYGLKKQNSPLVTYAYQLKVPAKDGRMRYTDVIDFAAMTAILHRMRKTSENIFFILPLCITFF